MKKYSIILENFKTIGNYHYLMAILTQLSMIMGYYVVLSLSIETHIPKFLCKSNETSEWLSCTKENYCSGIFDAKIDIEKSIKNWVYKHFKREDFCSGISVFRYLSSTIFFFAIFSALFMSIIADRKGRLFSYKLESIGNLIGYILLYYEQSIWHIFLGVSISEIFSHIYNTSLIYIYEFFPTNVYIYVVSFQNIGYGIIGLLISLYADHYKETSMILVIMCVFSLISTIYSFTILTESPDWLLSLLQNEKNIQTQIKIKKSLESSFTLICRINRRSEEKLNLLKRQLNLYDLVSKEEEEESKETEEKTFSTNFYKRFSLATFLWIVNQIMFYSTLSNLSLFEEKILNSKIIYFSSSILANISLAVFSNLFGVKSFIKYTCHAQTVLILLLIYLTDSKSLINQVLLPYVFFIFSFVSTACGETIYLYIPELFEPKNRSSANSYSKIPAKCLLVLAPFILGDSVFLLYYVFLFMTVTTPLMLYYLI